VSGVDRIAVVFLINGEETNCSGDPNGLLDRDTPSIEIVPQSWDSVSKGGFGHVRSDYVHSDVELGNVVSYTPHNAHDLVLEGRQLTRAYSVLGG